MRCAFPACNHDSSHTSSREITFHRLPDEVSLRSAWMEALGKTGWEPEPGSVVCSKHFLADDLVLTRIGRQLRSGAVPIASVRNDSGYDDLMMCYVKICRICFTTDHKLYSMTDFKGLNEAYETLTGVSTADEEHLPRYLCTQCADRLMNCARFRNRSLRAHLMLLDIVKRHGCITLELIQSIMRIHSPLNYNTALGLRDNHLDLTDQNLEEVYKLTNARGNTRLEDTDMYENVADIKPEIHDEIDENLFNNEHRSNVMAVDTIKTESDDLINEENILACSSKLEENIVVNGAALDTNNMVNGDNRSKCSFYSDEEITIDDIIAENDMINRDNISVCSFGVDEDTVVDGVNTDNEGIIDKNIVNDEATTDESLVFAASMYEDIVSTVLKLKYGDVCYKDGPKFEESSNDFTGHSHSFMFTGEDVLKNPSNSHKEKHTTNLTVQVQNAMKTPQGLNEMEIEKQRTPDAELSICDKLCCDMCSYQTVSDIEFLDHLKMHKIICERNVQAHSSEKSYPCGVCKKVFYRKHHLQTHLALHSNEKPFACDVCKKMFSLKIHLLNHVKTHSDTKPYSCHVCKKMFTAKGNLKRHLRIIHAGEKPYSCPVRKKMFGEKGSVRKHLKVHSGEKRYS